LDESRKRKVMEETEKRVRQSQSATYQPQSEEKKFRPWERVQTVLLMDRLSLFD
jgi:hypothetical protein